MKAGFSEVNSRIDTLEKVIWRRDLAADHSVGRAYLRASLQGAHWLGGVPGNKGRILKMRAQLAGSVCVWKQVVALPLCICLLASCSMRTARNQVVVPVSASETERLRDLLSGKRIDASLADGAHLRGRVKEIQDGLLVVDIDKSSGPNPAPRGLQDIPTDRISTVQFTRYEGNKRFLYAALFFLGGYGLAVGIIEGREGYSGVRTATAIGGWSAMTALGYPAGKKERQAERHLDDPTTRFNWWLREMRRHTLSKLFLLGAAPAA